MLCVWGFFFFFMDPPPSTSSSYSDLSSVERGRTLHGSQATRFSSLRIRSVGRAFHLRSFPSWMRGNHWTASSRKVSAAARTLGTKKRRTGFLPLVSFDQRSREEDPRSRNTRGLFENHALGSSGLLSSLSVHSLRSVAIHVTDSPHQRPLLPQSRVPFPLETDPFGADEARSKVPWALPTLWFVPFKIFYSAPPDEISALWLF